MGLEFALDELYASGWTDLDSMGCSRHSDGTVQGAVVGHCDSEAAVFALAQFRRQLAAV